MRVIETTDQRQMYSENYKTGATRVRTFKVFDLTDNRDPLYQAKTAVDGTKPSIRVPIVGSFHPVIPSIFCTDVSAQHFNTSWRQAIVAATYSAPTAQQGNQILTDIRVDGVSIMKETNFDSAGLPMWVYYADPSSKTTVKNDFSDQQTLAQAFASKSTGVLREMARTVVPVNANTLEFDFMRLGNPLAAFGDLENTLNSKDFQGDKPGTWWLRRIFGATSVPSGTKVTQKLIWKTGFLFQRTPRGKGAEYVSVFRDSRTGAIPSDIDPSGKSLGAGVLGRGNIGPSQPKGGVRISNIIPSGPNGIGVFDVLPWEDWRDMQIPDITNW